VLGVGIASLLSDIGHESATSLLPGILRGLGAKPAALGFIEGTADLFSSLAKLYAGRTAWRLPNLRRPAALGYVITGATNGVFAIAANWWQILGGRIVAWTARGYRGPLRDTLLAQAATRESFGKAFGLERGMDQVGAIIGPLLVAALVPGILNASLMLWVAGGFGVLAGLSILTLTRQKEVAEQKQARPVPLTPQYKKFLAAVAVFGAGDFSRTMLIWWASAGLGTGKAALLYMIYNVVTSVSAPVLGHLADKVGARRVLLCGYLVSAAAHAPLLWGEAVWASALCAFALSGLYISCEEVCEKAAAAHYLRDSQRAYGFSVLAALNGVGDFVASAVVGLLWTYSGYPAGAALAMLLSVAGVGLLWRAIKPNPPAVSN
jgi:MFS family permease